MYKRLFFVLVALGLLLLALFPAHVFFKLVEWRTKADFKKRFGADFTYEKIFLHEGKIHFLQGKISAPETFDATFEKATFSPYLDCTKKELGGTLKLYDLNLIHQRKAPILAFPSKVRLPFFKVNFRTLVEGGKLWMTGREEPMAFVVGQQLIGEKMVGTLHIECHDTPCESYFSYEKGVFELATYFHNHCFADMGTLLRYFFEESLPEPLRQWQCTEGSIDGKLFARFSNASASYLGGNLQLRHVKGVNETLGLMGSWETFTASFDMETSKAHQWKGEFSLTGGNLSFKEQSYPEIWDIDSLQSTIVVSNGQVETSFVKGRLLGLAGEITLDWQSEDKLMEIACSGSSKQMLPLIPEKFQKGFSLSLPDDELHLQAQLSRRLTGLELEGKLHIGEKHLVDFGCQFGGGMERALPLVSAPENDFINHLKSQFCLSKKRLGWFRAKNFPLEKFFSPYLFLDLPMELAGNVNVEGNFDERYVVIFYEGGRVSLKTPSFEIIAPQVADAFGKSAIHTVDLATKEHVGYLSLRGTKFRQKNYDFVLEDVTASVQFHNQIVHLSDVQTSWQGLPLRGEIDYLFRSLTDYELLISGGMKQGSCRVGSSLLSHFTDSPLTELEVLGTFSLEEMRFHFNKGELVLASLAGESAFEMAPFYEMAGKFTYEFPRKEFSFKDLGGKILLGKESPFFIPYGHIDSQGGELTLELGEERRQVLGFFNKATGKIAFEGENVALIGEKKGEKLLLSKVQWEGWEGHLEGRYQDHHLCLENLFMTHPEEGLVQLTGSYDLFSHSFEGKVEKMEMEAATLLPSFAYPLSGHLSAQGSLAYKDKVFSVHLQGKSRDLICGKIPLHEKEELSLHYQSNLGLTVEGLEILEACHLGRMRLDFASELLSLENFSFSLSEERVRALSSLARAYFPHELKEELLKTIGGLKREGLLEGRLKMNLRPQDLCLTLELSDGNYHFLNHNWEVKDFTLSYNPKNFYIKTTTFFQHQPYQLYLTSQTMKEGELCISDESDALRALWYKAAGERFTFKQITGSLLGFKAKLEEGTLESQEIIEMKGRVIVDPEKLAIFCPPAVKELYDRYKMGGDFVLEGTFRLSKSSPAQSTFHGRLEGSDCFFHNVELASISSHCYLSSDLIEFTNLEVKDWSGRLFLDRATMIRDEEWEFFLSRLILQDFRPFRLSNKGSRGARKERPLLRSLFVQSWDIRDFRGFLQQPQSYTARGELSFTNFPKKTLLSNLMFLPTEISARIGFDLSAFIPVRGSILYTIEKGKIHLTDLKEVYSEGKRSKFYLVDKSTIDFQGNMNINIRVKQYNLLLKLAELFTITVRGTLIHPSYFLTSSPD